MNPATGEPWAVIPEATDDDVDRAVEAAHRAFAEGPWSRITPTERGRSLRRLADLLKGSGYGRESGFQAIYDYTRPKTIRMNLSSEPMANPFVMR